MVKVYTLYVYIYDSLIQCSFHIVECKFKNNRNICGRKQRAGYLTAFHVALILQKPTTDFYFFSRKNMFVAFNHALKFMYVFIYR